jgi:hypothetical protein
MVNKKEKVVTPVAEPEQVGVNKDWLYVGGAAAGFFALLKGAGWIDQNFDFSAIFNVVDFSIVVAKVAFASALAWTVKKFIFKNTLGKDFGDTFDTGWNSMTSIEKARWILVIFSVMFTTIMVTLQ